MLAKIALLSGRCIEDLSEKSILRKILMKIHTKLPAKCKNKTKTVSFNGFSLKICFLTN